MRSFPATVAITAAPGDALAALGDGARGRGAQRRRSRRAARRIERAQRASAAQALAAEAEAGQGEPMSPAWISRCLDRVKGADAMLFNELACLPPQLTFTRPDGFFSHSLAGGLGWGLPAALGAQLACPERLVIAAVGDGSYMFANPVACHQLAEAQRLPVLTLRVQQRRLERGAQVDRRRSTPTATRCAATGCRSPRSSPRRATR